MIPNKNTARLNGFHERLAKKERIENDGKKNSEMGSEGAKVKINNPRR